MFEVPQQANPTDPTEGPIDQPPEVPQQANPTDPTEGPTDQPPEVPEQANPTDPIEGQTDQPPEVPDQANPTDATDSPTDQSPQQEQERPTSQHGFRRSNRRTTHGATCSNDLCFIFRLPSESAYKGRPYPSQAQ